MLLVSLMTNAAVWGHEHICVDFQKNNHSVCRQNMEANHSLECKSILIGMMRPELCDSRGCMFEKWMLYVALAKLLNLTLNLVVVIMTAVEYGRFSFGSDLQLVRPHASGNCNDRTLSFAKLGLLSMCAALCIVMAYFTYQFEPVEKELEDMGCLSCYTYFECTISVVMPLHIYMEMPFPFVFFIHGVADILLKTDRCNRYQRLSASIKSQEFFVHSRTARHFSLVGLYLLIWCFLALPASWASLCEIVDSVSMVHVLVASATTQSDPALPPRDARDRWCFYCRGERHAFKSTPTQFATAVAVKYIGWSLLALTSVALLGALIAAICSVRNNPGCILPDRRDR